MGGVLFGSGGWVGDGEGYLRFFGCNGFRCSLFGYDLGDVIFFPVPTPGWQSAPACQRHPLPSAPSQNRP